jgi:hypothetical protein
MSWTQIGLNFRSSAIFVTDGANETCCLGNTDVYPVTRGGATFGWDGLIGDMGRDREAGFDRRLAGMNQAANDGTSQTTFRLDLPATGSYTIRLALGDADNDQDYQWLRMFDNSTTLFTIADTDGVAAANYDDAFGTSWSAAAWPGSNVARTGVLFASTILKLTIGAPTAQANSTCIAHLFVMQEATATVKALTALGVG